MGMICGLILGGFYTKLLSFSSLHQFLPSKLFVKNALVTSSMYIAMVMQVRSAGDKRLQEERRNRQMLQHEIEKYRMYITHQDRYIRDLQRLLTNNSISYHDHCTPPPDIDT